MRALFFLTLSASVLADVEPALPGQRPRVLVAKIEPVKGLPEHSLPAGFTLTRAAAAPLVTHPTMGCLDDQGRLFLCDCIGVNWKKEQLDANPVNRVLMLEDQDQDGCYDRNTVFADKMTFPQGALWHQGSLFVCSPPAVWRLTDADGDGVAEQRVKIAGDFDYTGNAADIHGPFLHPLNGRIYWCHGRKGHKAVAQDGHVVDEGMACGIWSCKPDGSGLDWHALGCGDNPVEIDFTPDGDILGVQNLYGSHPRADTLIHWLHKGVYERADQMQVIAHLPQLLSPMPVVHDFGHVAVSGICFWRRSAWAKPGLQDLMVTHFNTQRLVRMELRAEAGSYKATETEFLRMEGAPDIHFTDVLEDPRDGSLLVIDTGGWFRIGCPSSLMEKPELLGAVYRIRPNAAPAAAQPRRLQIGSEAEALAALKADADQQRRACEWLATLPTEQRTDAMATALKQLLSQELPPALNFCALRAACYWPQAMPDIQASPAAMVNLIRLVANTARCGLELPVLKMQAAERLNSDDPAWAAAADAALHIGPPLGLGWHHLAAALKSGLSVEKLARWVPHAQADAKVQPLVLATLLKDARPAVQQMGLALLTTTAQQPCDEAWTTSLRQMFSLPTPALLSAVSRLKPQPFDAELLALSANAQQPISLRLRALSAMGSVKAEGATLDLLCQTVLESSSAAARIQAAQMLGRAGRHEAHPQRIQQLLAKAGPVELKELLPIIKAQKTEAAARPLVEALAGNAALAAMQESIYRTLLSSFPPTLFEQVILPALNAATASTEKKKRSLPLLAERAALADAAAGRLHFEQGKGSCIACHQVGDKGRAIGPNLSRIGAIRSERDLLESILFPSHTLARDYEAHVVETRSASLVGVIRSHTAEGLLLVDAAGVEHSLAHEQIMSDTVLPLSLMPMGLDHTLPEEELLQLVAYLRSLK